jgi:hypothetical protein
MGDFTAPCGKVFRDHNGSVPLWWRVSESYGTVPYRPRAENIGADLRQSSPEISGNPTPQI